MNSLPIPSSGKRQVQHYEWDAEHQLAAVHIEHQNQHEGQTEHWRYAYDPFIWHAHILPLHKKLRQQMGLRDPAPRKPALTRRILYYHTDHLIGKGGRDI